jgi:hypothetical protein
MRIPGTLRQLMYQQQCVAFVGAGFSMVCGMPGWGGLLRKLCDEAGSALVDESQDETLVRLRRAVEQNQLLLAVSLVRQLLPPVDLGRAIARLYDMAVFHNAPAPAQERMLNRLENLIVGPWAGMITTNYDTLIEHGLGKYTRGNYRQTTARDHDFGAILCDQPATRFFVKLHGSVRGADYVLGTEEYDRTYLTDPRVSAFLTTVMLRYHAVFIGCSLEDEVLRFRRRLCSSFEGHIPQAYALLPAVPDNLARKQWLFDQAKIVSLTYALPTSSADEDAHRAVDEFLAETRAGVDPVREADVRPIAGFGISSEMRNYPLQEKLQKIGSTNRELLQFILMASGENGIAHTDLLNPKTSRALSCPSSVAVLTPNERIYRALFLVSIDLLQQLSSPTAEPHFRLYPEVADVVTKYIKPGSNKRGKGAREAGARRSAPA